MTALTVHIGQPKAASSSLQRALWDGRDKLREAGIAYPVLGTKNHNGSTADFVTTRFPEILRAQPHLAASMRRAREPGSWDWLVAALDEAPRSIISSEYLAALPARLADVAVAELSGGGARPLEVVLVTRRTSRAWPSTYNQLAKDELVLPFESWTRAVLATVLNESGTALLMHTRVSQIRATWSGLAPVREVSFGSCDIAAFDDAITAALGIGAAVSVPFLGHRNASPSAARLAAWQDYQRRHGRAEPSLLRTATRPGDDVSATLPKGGGRFALTPETAELVDLAYPERDGSAPQMVAARSALARRVREPERLTTTGLDAAEFEESVRVCLADFEMRTRAGGGKG